MVVIPANLKRLLDLYIRECHHEISGLGRVEVQDGVFRITSLYLLDQEVTAGTTELSTLQVANFMASEIAQGRSTEDIRLWWHSHAKSNTFWSATDVKTIGQFDSSPWWLSIEGNHKGEYLIRLDVFPSDDLPIHLILPGRLRVEPDPEDLVKVQQEILERVHERVPVVVVPIGRLRRRKKSALTPTVVRLKVPE